MFTLVATGTYLRYSPNTTTYTVKETVDRPIESLPCKYGSYYDQGGLTCKICVKGFINFDPQAKFCDSCLLKKGLVCFGGAEYEIEDGYWVSPGAANCTSFECFSSRIYACGRADACTTGVHVGTQSSWVQGSWRNGSSPGSVSQMTFCKEGYLSTAVFCGGGVVSKCARFYNVDTGTGECVRCPSRAGIVARFMIFSVLGLFILSLLFRFLYKTFGIKSMNDPFNDTGVDEEKLPGAGAGGDKNSAAKITILTPEERDLRERKRIEMEQELRDAKKSRAVISILTGWIQIMGQMGTMADDSLSPSALKHVTDGLSYLNVDIVALVSFKCMVDEFSYTETSTDGDGSSMFGYWWGLSGSPACFPSFIPCVFVRSITIQYQSVCSVGRYRDAVAVCRVLFFYSSLFSLNLAPARPSLRSSTPARTRAHRSRARRHDRRRGPAPNPPGGSSSR